MWHTHGIAELARAMADGRLTAVALTRHFLDRIDALNQAAPALNAVRELNPAALDIAAALDAQRLSLIHI